MAEKLSEKIIEQPEKKVIAKGKKVTKICEPEMIDTPAGPEQVLQKARLERRVERDETGEKIVKNVAISDLHESGYIVKNVLGIQQL